MFLHDAIQSWIGSREPACGAGRSSGTSAVAQFVTFRHLQLFLALKLALLLLLALNTRFVMDEFWQAGNAKIVGEELYQSIWPVKAMGAALFYRLAYWLGDTSTEIMLLARLQTAALAIAVLVLLYRIGRNIGQSRWQALLTVCVCIAFSTFMERAFRTRAEPLALFFATAALWTVTSRRQQLMTVGLAGLLSGLAFLATQKAVYFDVALGLALTADAVVRRRPLRALTEGAVLVLGWGAALLAYSAILGGEHAGEVMWHLFLGPRQLALEGGAYYADMHVYILRMLQQNVLPMLICGMGLVLALRHMREHTAERRVAAIFTVIVTILVFNHSQPWPYVFIMIVPFLALWAPDALSAVPRQASTCPLVLFLIVGAALSLARNIYYLGHDNRQQLRVLEQAETMLLPGESYLDGTGMLARRPDAGRAWWDQPAIATLRARFAAGERGALNDVFAAQPKIVILSYRTAALGSLLAPYLKGSYLRIQANVMVAGTALRPGEITRFTARWAGDYRLYRPDGSPLGLPLTVDDALVRGVVPLTSGEHRLTLPADAPDAVLLPVGMDFAFRLPPRPDQRLFANVYD